MGKIDDNKWQVDGVEHIVAIAKQKDYKVWRTLWDAGDLKGKRANPFILFHGDLNRKLKHTEGGKEVRGAAGDVLTAPNAAPKKASGKIDKKNSFTRGDKKVYLRLRVFDHDMQPLPAEATWKLVIAGITYPRSRKSGASSGGEPPVAEGTFKSGGLINVRLSRNTDWSAAGTLFVKYPAPKPKEKSAQAESGASTPASGSTAAPTATSGSASGSGGSAASGGSASPADADAAPKMIEVKFKLLIGRLDPIQEKAPDKRCTSGVQQRLNNMGFNSGPVDGAVGPITKAAITRFQRMAEVTVTSKADDATQKKLHELHDRPGKPPTQEADTSKKGVAGTADVGSASGDGGGGEGAAATKKLSGTSWIAWRNTNVSKSKSLDDLSSPFKEDAKAFKKALDAAGAEVQVTDTLRDMKEAYLWHWAWLIDQDGYDPKTVPARDDVPIEWDHGDDAKSKAGAKEIVDGFGLAKKPKNRFAPSLTSNHLKGKAVDMTISWSGELKIKNKAGTEITITTDPKTGAANTKLHDVGKSYGVKKLVGDAPHWSHNGH